VTRVASRWWVAFAAAGSLLGAPACSSVDANQIQSSDARPPEDGSRDGHSADREISRDGPPGAEGGDASQDARSDAAKDAGNDANLDASHEAGCAPGAQQCSGSTAIETCGSSGKWQPSWPCSSGVCASGACTQPTTTAAPSCTSSEELPINCGEAGTESCCTSLEVNGSNFYRTYSSELDGGPIGEADPATVSSFRLDKYDVTVGRFRQFVSAVLPPPDHGTDGGKGDAGGVEGGIEDADPSEGGTGGGGWIPEAGSGIHTHLNEGKGLLNSSSPGGYETGWVTADNSNVAPSSVNLGSCSPYSTWTDAVGTQENLPIDCVNWYEAYAFCIWDGGFLPSQAEWEYAAAGGAREREYPWGAAPPGVSNEYAIYGCLYPVGSDAGCGGVTNIAPVGSAPLGAGAWGQLDLAGEMYQWNLDWYAAYADPCVDCGSLTAGTSGRVIRGGDFYHSESVLLPTSLYDFPPTNRNYFVGFRCARTP
jgi:formylglycine-generating enzyme